MLLTPLFLSLSPKARGTDLLVPHEVAARRMQLQVLVEVLIHDGRLKEVPQGDVVVEPTLLVTTSTRDISKLSIRLAPNSAA